jgi:phage terminase large subunit
MSVLQLETPEWALPLLEPSRYKGAWGGRGSGKSHMFAELMIEAHIMNQKRRSVCVREIQKSLNQSVKRLLETKIQAMNAGAYFEVQDSVIKSKKGDGAIIFPGYAEPHRRLDQVAGGLRLRVGRGSPEPEPDQP